MLTLSASFQVAAAGYTYTAGIFKRKAVPIGTSCCCLHERHRRGMMIDTAHAAPRTLNCQSRKLRKLFGEFGGRARTPNSICARRRQNANDAGEVAHRGVAGTYRFCGSSNAAGCRERTNSEVANSRRSKLMPSLGAAPPQVRRRGWRASCELREGAIHAAKIRALRTYRGIVLCGRLTLSRATESCIM